MKFWIVGTNTGHPGVYFMNTNTYRAHPMFAGAVGIRSGGARHRAPCAATSCTTPTPPAPTARRARTASRSSPTTRTPSPTSRWPTSCSPRACRCLDNNLLYYPFPQAALPLYQKEKALYDASRVPVLVAMSRTVGPVARRTGGRRSPRRGAAAVLEQLDARRRARPRRHALGEPTSPVRSTRTRRRSPPSTRQSASACCGVMTLEERPDPRDVVIYEALPNEMPRVAGVITTVGADAAVAREPAGRAGQGAQRLRRRRARRPRRSRR